MPAGGRRGPAVDLFEGVARLFNKYVRNLLVWALILVVVLYLVLPLYNNRGTSSEVVAYSAFISEAQRDTSIR